ncbi:MAG: TMEM43 family protein [Thermoguttaceae bacterium]|nr:TMEM43 family protein [Thermoguttaceae bacterium]
MTYTETTNESWFSRLGGAFKGILIGIVLIIIAIVLLFWNEGRTIQRYKALKEGEANAVSVDPDSVNSSNDGKLVYMTGKAETSEILTDDEFAISVNAIQLARTVEMYQWQENSKSETKKKFGGGTETVTTYTYEKKWSATYLDSSEYKESGHENPNLPYESMVRYATEVKLGAFKLPDNLIQQIGPKVDFQIKPEETPQEGTPGKEIPSTEKTEEASPAVSVDGISPLRLVAWQDSGSISISGNSNLSTDSVISISDNSKPIDPSISNDSVTNSRLPRIVNGGYYIGNDPAQPAIGDVRISYSVVYPNTDISIISQQSGETFVPYQTKNGAITLLENGRHSMEEMFATAQNSNKMMGWILRCVGLILMIIGFSTIMSPLSVLGDVTPFIGTLIGVGTGIVSFVLGFALSLGTISIAWLFYRPFIGIPLLIAAIALPIFFLKWKNKTADA